MPYLIDHAAKEIALRRYVVPECLHVPIAAIDESAIRNYIGEIQQVLGRGSPAKAFVVSVKEPPPVDIRHETRPSAVAAWLAIHRYDSQRSHAGTISRPYTRCSIRAS